MAEGFSSTGGGSSSGRGSATVGGSQVISPLAIPELLKLFNRAQGAVPTELNSLQDIVQGGMQSPLLQLVLGPALQRLQAPQAQQRENLTEATRAAGGLRGSTYGQDMNTLMNNQALQTNDLMSAVLQQILAPLISGQLQEQRNSFLPAESFTNLLRAASPSVARGGATATSGWENIPPSLGLGTPMSGSSTPGFDSFTAQLNAPRTGGSAIIGPNAPGMNGNPAAPATQPYTPFIPAMAPDPEAQRRQFLADVAKQQTVGEWENIPRVTEGWW